MEILEKVVYKYTKIESLFSLKEFPSDFEGEYKAVDLKNEIIEINDVVLSDFEEFPIRSIRICKLKSICLNEKDSIAQWKLEILISGVLPGESTIVEQFLDSLCDIFSLNIDLNYIPQFCGISRIEHSKFSDRLFYSVNGIGFIEKCLYPTSCHEEIVQSLPMNTIFNIPIQTNKSDLLKNIESTYIRAMAVKEPISRYIMLYFVFELLFGTTKYKDYRDKYGNKNRKTGVPNDTNRSKVFYLYLSEELKITEYFFFSVKQYLSEERLLKLIDTRNNLVHHGKYDEISYLLKQDFIPIVKEIIKSLQKKNFSDDKN